MASTSGSGASATTYDVFLSSIRADTHDNFTDCLHRAMVAEKIVVYKDSEDLPVGERIDELKAVGKSKIFMPVLTSGYPSSDGPPRLLARAMDLKELTEKPEILPIFLDVTPSDVRLRWEAALGRVGEISGWDVQGKGYGEVIDLVVKEVLRKLNIEQRPPLGRRRENDGPRNLFERNVFIHNNF